MGNWPIPKVPDASQVDDLESDLVRPSSGTRRERQRQHDHDARLGADGAKIGLWAQF